MKMKPGKKYETKDGEICIFDECDPKSKFVRRRYSKGKPKSKLKLVQGDIVKLVGWTDGDTFYTGRVYEHTGKRLEATPEFPPGFFHLTDDSEDDVLPLFVIIHSAYGADE